MDKIIKNLHCGACMENFYNTKDLKNHIDKCPAAEELLPLINFINFGGDKIGHPISHFIRNCHENVHLIKRYAYSISDEMNSLERSKIHFELCKKLGLDYNNFKPFEDSNIKEIPSRYESERILWKALHNAALEL